MASFFLPGWGLTAQMYEEELPEGWSTLEPEAFARGHDWAFYRRWAIEEIERHQGRVRLAGHSMGAALAIAAAAARPEQVERLTLLEPAGLPARVGIVGSGLHLAEGFLNGGWGRAMMLKRGLDLALSLPAGLLLARELDQLDLSDDLLELRRRGMAVAVVAHPGDRLTPAASCRQMAELAGGSYREVSYRGDHLWPLVEPGALRRELAQSEAPASQPG